MSAGIRRLLVVIAVVGLLSALFLFGILRDPTRRDDLPSALLNKQTPAFTMPLFDRYRTEFGTEFDAAAERGTPLVINFWASWCLPCREEMPVLEASWREYRDSVLFVGVNTQERSASGAQALMNEFGLTYPNGVDENNRINIDYGLFGLPETFFVRADGTLQYRHSGAVTQEVMDEQIRALLSGS
jgi:cytochrome c biogenesis protein CcmG, thiol:disulfide interchange protein DsbE